MTFGAAATQLVAEWIHPASLICAALLPNVRALIRRARINRPAYTTPLVVHDAMSGFALPSFFALCLLPIAPDLRPHLDTTHLVLAGVLGIVFVFSEVVSVEPERDRLL
jgi:hypothetical protein